MTKTIEDKLTIYGPSTCPLCGNHRETIFAHSKAGPLVCRRHPGHPLYFLHAPEPEPVQPPEPAPLRV